MKRTNSPADALNRNKITVSVGDGLPDIELPLDGNFGGGKGEKGEGVPEGGAPLQVVRKTAAGTTTEWATLTPSTVGLSNVDNTADAEKPLSEPQAQALTNKADLVGGKVPESQLPEITPVTDSTIAPLINGATTGAAIDARINTQVAPQVQKITADYIAGDRAVVDSAAAAVNASPKIAEMENGKPLGTEHLSTILAPGSYYQASNTHATLDRGYPVALAGDMTVRPWGAPGAGRYQRRYYPYTGGRFYTQNVVGGVADPWITFDSIRDTGWRNIDVSDVTGSIRDATAPGTLRLRRVGATVTARIEGVKLAPGTGGGFMFPNVIPTGFGGWNKLGSAIRASMGDVLGSQWEHDVYVTDNDIFWAAATSTSLAKSTTRPSDPAHRVQGEMSWTTDHSFPNTLPGTAV